MSSSTQSSKEARSYRQPSQKGRLKIFLGYAAGVGKTYRMLEEAQKVKQQGRDIVVGYFEPHGRKDTIAKTAGLDFVPRRKLAYRGTSCEEMDTPAILERRPAICIIDELAHTNIPGLEHTKRWEDVQMILGAGIDVWTNMNIQHLESLNDHVFQISGIRVRETVPDWFVKDADEIVMVDATTGALLNRLKRGDIYAKEKAQQAMDNFFKESTLSALRELALRQTAHELELREEISESELQAVSTSEAHRKTGGSILICVRPDPSTAGLIRRGRRMADYLNADCFALYAGPCHDLSKGDREAIEKHLSFARNLHIETQVLEVKDAAQAIVDFAQGNKVTQIVLARTRSKWWRHLLRTDLILQVVRKAKDIRVVIVAERRRPI
jgi:two-component system, OmpR family, sensor histidine kinase KdpD